MFLPKLINPLSLIMSTNLQFEDLDIAYKRLDKSFVVETLWNVDTSDYTTKDLVSHYCEVHEAEKEYNLAKVAVASAKYATQSERAGDIYNKLYRYDPLRATGIYDSIHGAALDAYREETKTCAKDTATSLSDFIRNISSLQ